MTYNDILRRIRYTFDFEDAKMIELFGLGGREVSRSEVSNWLKKEEEDTFEACNDADLAIFLNGLIINNRGRKEGAAPRVESKLTNNIIFTKLKIALNLKAEEVLDVLKLANFRLSKHELSAFFRKPGHKHFRSCRDQVLRNFLKGMQIKYRDKDVVQGNAALTEPKSPWKIT